MSLFDRIADRIHAAADTAARAQGLTVTRLPNGRRRIGHPELAELFEARRRHVIRHGFNPADRLLLDASTLAALDATAARMAHAIARPQRCEGGSWCRCPASTPCQRPAPVTGRIAA